tara:strand:- start:24222 stop:25463 length:1242 start_codon:yes stop_codon:yes gene_type:complete
MLSNEVVNINIIANNETGEIEVIENKITTKKEEDEYITPQDYFDNPDIIKKMKLPDLRKTLKFYKNSMIIPNNSTQQIKNAKAAVKSLHDFTLVGNKKDILQRLVNYFDQERLVVKIQKIIRAYFVKKLFTLIGPGFKDKNICVNTVDFSTLENLNEITIFDFYSYKDQNNKIYGFKLSSLNTLIKKRKYKPIENPFNRENINYLLDDINKLKRINKIVQTKFIPPKRKIIQQNVKPIRRIRNNNTRNNTPFTRIHESLLHEYNYDCEMMLNFLRTTRSKTIQERARLLFTEIDNLGNYSNYEWFSSLDRRGYIRFFRILRDIWVYRAQIPVRIKFKICPLWDPFLILTDINSLNELSIEQLQSLCLSVMEDMIYTGVDNEFKTLGALHVLSVLTVVNHGARQALPWLYESLI